MTKAIASSRPVRDDYLRLIRAFPLRAIRNDRELDAALAMIQKLMLRPEESLSVGQKDYLNALAVLVHAYEQEHYPMPDDNRPPLARLKYLLRESGASVTVVGRIIGSQPLASMIVNGQRGMSKTVINKLAKHFRLNPGYFM